MFLHLSVILFTGCRDLCPGISVHWGSLSIGVSVQGDLCPGGGVSVQEEGLYPGGPCPGGLYPGGLYPGGSISRGVSVKGSLSRGLCPGGLCLDVGLCLEGVSVHGVSVRRPVYGNVWAVWILLECTLVGFIVLVIKLFCEPSKTMRVKV